MEAHAAVAMEQAVALFDQQKYSEAFELFVEVYQQCQDLSERQGIFQILEDAYYLPNREEFRENYESNTALLKNTLIFGINPFIPLKSCPFSCFQSAMITIIAMIGQQTGFTGFMTLRPDIRCGISSRIWIGPFK